jgi:hypothetical protein
MMPAPRIVGLVFLVAAGCVATESAPPRAPVVQPAAPSAARPRDQSAAKKIPASPFSGGAASEAGERRSGEAGGVATP